MPNGKVFKQAYLFHETISKESPYSTSYSTNKYDIDTEEIARRKENQLIFTSVTYSFESRAWLNDDDHTIVNKAFWGIDRGQMPYYPIMNDVLLRTTSSSCTSIESSTDLYNAEDKEQCHGHTICQNDTGHYLGKSYQAHSVT